MDSKIKPCLYPSSGGNVGYYVLVLTSLLVEPFLETHYSTQPQYSDTHRAKSVFFPRFNFKKRSHAIAQTCILQSSKVLTAFRISGTEEQAGSISRRLSVSLLMSACSKSIPTHTHTSTHTRAHTCTLLMPSSQFSLFGNIKNSFRMLEVIKQTI